MTTPTQEDLKAYLAEKSVTIDERVAAVCADPAVTDRLSGPVLSLAQLRAIVESHNAGARTEWSPDELAQLIVFVGAPRIKEATRGGPGSLEWIFPWKWQPEKGPPWPLKKGPPRRRSVAENRSRLRPGSPPHDRLRSVR